MQKKVPHLTAVQDIFIESKQKILVQWVSYTSIKETLEVYGIDREFFLEKYAVGVFDYFMEVISGEVEIGHCPIMKELLAYLKFREISADELFEICSHFRRAMIEFSYDAGINSKELFQELSYIYDKNFRAILKFYTDTIFQKLIDAKQEALHAGQAKEYFLSNMSHEIRTPLNAILGFVNLLIEEDVSKKHKNYLDIILSSGENLLSIINDILDFSKLRSGKFTIEPRIFSLHEELSHAMELFVASANSKDITITSFIDPTIPRELYGDSLRIKQILSNFLSNAIKFTPQNGVISVEAIYSNRNLKISVSDNGIGIEAKDIKNIFTAFAQAQYTENNNNDGTGLGLSICHQLAQHMDGFVGVESKLGSGSTFWMEIPIDIYTEQCQVFEDIQEFQKLTMLVYAKDAKTSYKHEAFIKYAEVFNMKISVSDSFEEDFDVGIFVHEECDNEFKNKLINSDKKFVALMSKQYDYYDNYKHISPMCFPLYCSKIHTIFEDLIHPQENLQYSRSVSQKFKGHILIAEDNKENQELIKILLMKYGLTYDLASNGLEALNFYKKNIYDLILMDEQMPIMDGNEAVKKILEFENKNSLRHTPISALTANVIKGARERGLLSGFDSFLGKPIVLKELERVFLSYLKVDTQQICTKNAQKNSKTSIVGLDAKRLSEELMLSYDEIVVLLTLFIKKMAKILPDLHKAIKNRDFKKIAMSAHSIKGSSGNFRIESLQLSADEMEEMAKAENNDYNYEQTFQKIQGIIKEIKIS